MQKVEAVIRERSPFLKRDSAVFLELLTFFGESSKVVSNLQDLRDFLLPKRLYKVVRVRSDSLVKCAYALVDDHPEVTGALGMLRYYKSPGEMPWVDLERAENVLSDALMMDVYAWKPDAFRAFENAGVESYELTAILAMPF